MTKRITFTAAPAAYNNKEQSWNRNTALGVDLKTLLSSDPAMRPAKEYRGVLRLDTDCDDFRYDEHYTFIETKPLTAGKRNLRLFDGELITVTRRDDGSYRPNFRPIPRDEDFRLERYVTGVAQELVMELWAGRGKVKR